MRSVRSVLRGGLALLALAAALGLAPPAGADVLLTGATGAGARSATSCAVVEGQRVACWGRGTHGQLGNGAGEDSTLAVLVQAVGVPGPLTGVTQVTVGDEHACARLANGRAVCWGNNGAGRLGDGTTTDRARPVYVRNGADTAAMAGVTQLTAGSAHTCARLSNGRVTCWGANTEGQIGDGTGVTHDLPTLVLAANGAAPLTDVAQVVAGRTSTCARKAGGQVRCWGDNVHGQLGDGTHADRDLPGPVVGVGGVGRLTGVAQLAATDHHVCARLTNRRARCWGLGSEGELGAGDGQNRTTPVSPEQSDGSPLVNVAQVAVGTNHSCFRLVSGRVRCAGYGGNGQLGNPAAADQQLTPILVRNAIDTAPLSGVAQIVLGSAHTCGRLTSGLVACWGQNVFGQLGDGTNLDHGHPVAVRRPDGA